MKKYSTDSDGLVEVVKRSSGAVAGLYKWASATLNAYGIFRDVEPKRKKAETMRAAKIKGEKELAETIAKVEELNKNVAELNAAMKEKKDELDALEAESQLMTRKLNAASQLITGLSGE